MPKRADIHTILIIGAGPIVIGQACEFDYSGAQACKALREEGYRVVLVNSNPATIMTDPEMADATYIEPITPEFVEKIIARERPNVPPRLFRSGEHCFKSRQDFYCSQCISHSELRHRTSPRAAASPFTLRPSNLRACSQASNVTTASLLSEVD